MVNSVEKKVREGIIASLENLSFEEAMGELEAIVTTLESGSIDLDKAIDAFTKGSALKAHCLKRLDEAKMKVETIEAAA